VTYFRSPPALPAEGGGLDLDALRKLHSVFRTKVLILNLIVPTVNPTAQEPLALWGLEELLDPPPEEGDEAAHLRSTLGEALKLLARLTPLAAPKGASGERAPASSLSEVLGSGRASGLPVCGFHRPAARPAGGTRPGGETGQACQRVGNSTALCPALPTCLAGGGANG
jgi:hypothetical protein